MNKVFGIKSCYAPVRQERTRLVISYGYTEEPDGINATWYELYFPRRKGNVTINKVKESVWEDINKQTDEKILSGFTWTPANADAINVWLSEENQRNFSEAQRIAMMMPEVILPVKFKLGEEKDGTPIYYQFTTSEELTSFYLQAVAFINQCLSEGWTRKDTINWHPYEDSEYIVKDNNNNKETE